MNPVLPEDDPGGQDSIEQAIELPLGDRHHGRARSRRFFTLLGCDVGAEDARARRQRP